jgi:hypothetical protein
MRQKQYNRTASDYAEKIKKMGYSISFNWTDPNGGFYEDVTVRGDLWRGYGTEFPTPRKAYEYIRQH